jgi:hypothetical protein
MQKKKVKKQEKEKDALLPSQEWNGDARRALTRSSIFHGICAA